MDDDETIFDVEENYSSEIPKISLQELLDDFRSNEFTENLTALEKCISALMGNDENIIEFHESIYLDVLNKCLQWVSNYIFNLPKDKVAYHITFRKFLFLFTEKRLSSSLENSEISDLRLSIINNGTILVKMCIENECMAEIGYYMRRVERESGILIEFCNENNLSNKPIILKKIELALYGIEKMIAEDKIETALEELSRQKENVLSSKKFRDYYIGLCYNASLKFSKVNIYNYSLTGLLLAYDVCKTSRTLSKTMKTALRFLACLCLYHDPEKNWHHGMNALNLAYSNDGELDMFYVISKIKLAIVSNQEQSLEEVLVRVIEWKDIEMKNIIQIIEFLRKNGQSLFAADIARRIRCNLSSIGDQFSLMKLEFQLYISENDRRMFTVVERCIEMIKVKEVPADSINDLYKLLLSHAASKFREKHYKDSLNWYTYCVRICEVGNLEKSLLNHVQSRICLCHLEMKEFGHAKEDFKSLRVLPESSDPLYIYLALQIAFIEGDEKLVDETLRSCYKISII